MSYSDGVAEKVIGFASAALAFAARSALGLGAMPCPVSLPRLGGGVRALGGGGGVLALGGGGGVLALGGGGVLALGTEAAAARAAGEALARADGAALALGAPVAGVPLMGSLGDGGFFTATMTRNTHW